MTNFYGRSRELDRLNWYKEKSTASFLIIRGRRRIGKSSLIKEFSKNFAQVYSFIGMAPTKKTTNQDQLNEFSNQMTRVFKSSYAKYYDWSDAFFACGERVQHGQSLIVFDEISWMGSKDVNFLSKIKNLWDQQLKNNNKLIFIICGSASSWIEENILSNTGFVGRISATITLDELPVEDCNKFWNSNISAYEKFKILSITGGVPRYLEEINLKYSAEENIKRLSFTAGGLFVDEFEKIFADIFLRNSMLYKKILHVIASGSKEQKEIANALKAKNVGRINEYLKELELSGFISRDFSWSLNNQKPLKSSLYRLSDNYLRFYLKFIEPVIDKIRSDTYSSPKIESLPTWTSIMGLQFENLVIKNCHELYDLLKIDVIDIVNKGPFYQKTNSKQKGCQIDLLIQTKHNNLYICEIKFSKNLIGKSVIDEFRSKVQTMKRPKSFSIRTVLIHVNGVTEDLKDSNYFDYIIDFSKYLK